MNNEEIIESKYPLCIAAGVDGNEFEERHLDLTLTINEKVELKLKKDYQYQ